MGFYRKKPVVIEAVQFLQENEKALVAHLEGCTVEGLPSWRMVTDGIIITTLEGDHLASPGDWIIKGVKGEYYPCKPDIFEATYDEVFDREIKPNFPGDVTYGAEGRRGNTG